MMIHLGLMIPKTESYTDIGCVIENVPVGVPIGECDNGGPREVV